MTDRQIQLIRKISYIEQKKQLLNTELNLLELEYIELSNKLFDSIEDKGKVKVLLNGEKVSNY